MDTSALDWQKEIFIKGFAGISPVVPVDFRRLEARAKKKISAKAFAYIAGGAGAEDTAEHNRAAFGKVRIVPRMLRNAANRDTSIELFGTRIPSPLLLSPVGVLELAHRGADLAVARAAARLGLPFIFSNQASIAMEPCARVMENSPRWFQLYWSKSEDLVRSFIGRAEACACQAIVVTLDTTLLGWRPRDLDLGYLPFLEGRGIAQYATDSVFLKMLEEPEETPRVRTRPTLKSIAGVLRMIANYPGEGFVSGLRSGRPLKAVRKFISTYSNPRTTWEDLPRLRKMTNLPLLLKGILHPDDALRAIDSGIDGIIVSNHGGRQVDGAVSSLEMLPAIVRATGKKISIIADSGIRSGADAFKAIALGADAVCIGRPYVYGLAIAGEAGVYAVLRNCMAEFELTMALAGCRDVSQIGPDCVITSF